MGMSINPRFLLGSDTHPPAFSRSADLAEPAHIWPGSPWGNVTSGSYKETSGVVAAEEVVRPRSGRTIREGTFRAISSFHSGLPFRHGRGVRSRRNMLLRRRELCWFPYALNCRANAQE